MYRKQFDIYYSSPSYVCNSICQSHSVYATASVNHIGLYTKYVPNGWYK